MEMPPSTFQEFLNYRQLKNWPENPFMEEHLPEDVFAVNNFSLKMIYEEFIKEVPFNSNVFEDLDANIAKHMAVLDSYTFQITYLPISEDRFCSLNRAFVTEVEFLKLSEKAQDKIEALSRINYETENIVENCVFPGFNTADLPGHLEATHILQSIVENEQYQDQRGKMLSKFLLSETTVAMLKDCFWWFFLHRFKPQKLVQDQLFDRLSDSFVSLFCQIPTDLKDFFFKIYPNYLSQAVFTAFYKAFPQSLPQFNGEFRSEIVDLIFQWVSGIQAVSDSWKKWNLHFLENSTHQFAKGNFALQLESRPNVVRQQLEFNLDNLIQEARESNLSTTVDREEKDLPTKESHTIGPGPEFHHTLFNLGGHSLLVSNYLKRHKLKDFMHVGLRHKLKRTEICKVPPVGPTYQDVKRETQKMRKSLQQEYEMLESNTQKEIAEIQHQNVKVKWQIEKIKQELSSGGKLNTTLLLENLHKMPFSSKLFMKDDLTIQDILDGDDSEPDSEQTLVML